jgi:hypothetical protein
MSYMVAPEQRRALVEAALDSSKTSDFQSLARQYRPHIPSITEPTTGLGLIQCCVLSGSIDSGERATRS